ncbi:hypothetical protein JM84_2014 [Dokdonia sp. Hel_I_63]|uniref:hypothetical protein n=1 Tax=unclassified Dokdonia TaxID=2615033 RepID=UPI00020A66C5|nr:MULTISPECIES: hypothetical protein [unclassified Dokdonia]AEE20647.1 hypothetical protein Krodi_2671 [Dokdonia sp. 4H-3-7-5]AWH75251.1 hypothetical protein DCS32_14080 [Dokdonia sp. Dokd-P16]TVZ23097.1 hypothetical protein JM84_2014 [Dokdonia sp. Hel_I_63]
MNTLQDSKAVNLIKKLIGDVAQNGIITNTVVEDLKALRPHTITEQLPLLAKATRLAAEHIEETGTFAIPIPADDDIEDENEEIIAAADPAESTPEESLHYFFCLIRDVDKKTNEDELREYVKALREY